MEKGDAKEIVYCVLCMLTVFYADKVASGDYVEFAAWAACGTVASMWTYRLLKGRA